MPEPGLGRRKDGALAAFGRTRGPPAQGAMLSPFCAADQDRACFGFYAAGPLRLAGKRRRLQLRCLARQEERKSAAGLK